VLGHRSGFALALATAFLTLFIGLGLVPGCMMAPAQRREEGLTKAAREFNDDLRWGRYEKVTPYLSKEESRALLVRKADLGDDFAMADNELTLIDFQPGSHKATVVADFTWYNQRRALVMKSTIEQTWEWTDGRWKVTEQHRIRGERFPLVPEPLSQAKADVPAAAGAPARSP
jgi:hypothetical protein